MCPGCIGSALLLLSSAGSAGGLAAAFKLRSLHRTRHGHAPSANERAQAGTGAPERAVLLSAVQPGRSSER